MSIDTSQPEPPGCSSAAGGGLWPALFLMGALVAMRRRKGLPLLALLGMTAMLPAPAAAQSAWNYVKFQQPKTYEPITSGSEVTLSPVTDGIAKINTPFTFQFYGQHYNEITISGRGIIVFGGDVTSVTSSNRTIPYSYEPNGFIAPWWTSLVKGATGKITTREVGVEPYRTFIIQFDDWKRNWDTDNYSLFDFQVRLHEGTNDIQIIYGPMKVVRDNDDTHSSEATAGIESPDGTRGVKGLACTPECGELDFPSNTEIYFTAEPNPEIEMATARPIGHEGMPLRVSGSVANLGGRTARDVLVQARWSEDPTYERDGDDPLPTVGGEHRVTVAPFDSTDFTFEVLLPDNLEPGGHYWVFVDVNPGTNHLFNLEPWSQPLEVVIGAPTPDWATKVVAADERIAFDTPATVQFEIRNAGNLQGEVPWRVVLSENDVISANDLVLDEGTRALASGEVWTATSEFAIPGTVPAGSYYLGVLADPEDLLDEPNEMDNAAATAFPSVVGRSEVEVVKSPLPPAVVGQPYQVNLKAVGGSGEYRWLTLNSSSLPPGLELTADGSLQGHPEVVGQQAVWVGVESPSLTDGRIRRASATLALVVAEVDAALTMVTQQLPDAVYASEYAASLIAMGGLPPYLWTVEEGALPRGLGLGEGGMLGGVPQEYGVFDVPVTVTDAEGTSATSTLSLRVAAPGNLVITTPSVPEARIGEQYSTTFEAIGGSEPYAWEAESALPQGLTLDEQTGELSGVPREVGVFEVMVRVGDALQRFDTNTFRLVVGYDHGVNVTNVVLPTITTGEHYRVQLVATGGLDPYRWRLAGGSLPDGLMLETDGSISGVPLLDDPGLYPFVVEVTDAAGRKAIAGLALRMEAAPPVKIKEGCSAAAGSAGGMALFLVIVAGAIRRRATSQR